MLEIRDDDIISLSADYSLYSLDLKYRKYRLFNVKDVEGTMRDIAEACFRQVIGDSTIDEALTTGKLKVQNRTSELMQTVVDIVTKLQNKELELDEAWGNLEYFNFPEFN